MTPPASFSLLAPAYFKKYGLDAEKGKDVISRIAWKNHRNGAKNPKAQFQKEVLDGDDQELAENRRSARHHGLLGRVRRRGGGDRGACRRRAQVCKDPIYIKALSFVAGPGEGPLSQEYDFTTFPEVVASAQRRLRAGRNQQSARSRSAWPKCTTASRRPNWCFTKIMGFSPRGTAWQDVMEGFFDLDGKLPVNPDGGLKSFGHPIGASGLRMMYEMWLQLRGEAGPRQIDNPKVGLTHNLGGAARPLRQLRLGGRPLAGLTAQAHVRIESPRLTASAVGRQAWVLTFSRTWFRFRMIQ